MEQKTGILSDIIYYNDSNGYTIAVIENEEAQEQFTAVGYLHNRIGKVLPLNGQLENSPHLRRAIVFETYVEKYLNAEGIQNFSVPS